MEVECALCSKLIERSRSCGGCGGLAYCCQDHQIAHWNAAHSSDCERFAQQMRRAEDLFSFPFDFADEATFEVERRGLTICEFLERRGLHGHGIWRAECSCVYENGLGYGIAADEDDSWHLPPSLLPSHSELVVAERLTDWTAYYKWRGLPFDSPAALPLHFPLTVYHALWLAIESGSVPKPLVGSSIRIHYLGPERELDALAAFAELSVLLPGIRICLRMIGPAVPHSRNGSTVEILPHGASWRPEALSATENAVSISFHSGLYHDIFRSAFQDEEPVLVVAPNAGIAAFSSWLPTLEMLSQRGKPPAVFSDWCEEAAELAVRAMSSVYTGLISLPIQINPFRRPFSSGRKDMALPTLSNAFIFGMNFTPSV